MDELTAATGRMVYPGVVARVLAHGEPRVARGRKTLDVGFTTIKLDTPFDALPTGTGRRANLAIAAVEALQLIGGFSNPALMLKITQRFAEFMDGGHFHGAYGSRIKTQAVEVVNKLRRDEGSRQAVITLWDAHLDNLPGKRDYPCTVMLQFEVHDAKLCMNVVMRSNDVWLGLPYDLFQFTQLQMSLARSLGLAYGWYRHTVLSLHLYEEDVEKCSAIRVPLDPHVIFQPQGVGHEKEDFPTIMKTARRLAAGRHAEDETMSEGWYADVLASYVG